MRNRIGQGKRMIALLVVFGSLLAFESGYASEVMSREVPSDGAVQVRRGEQPRGSVPASIRRIVLKALEILGVPKP